MDIASNILTSTGLPGGRRSDAGSVRLGGRDVAGLMLVWDMYGGPYDLLAGHLDVAPARLRGIVARWRRAGYAATGRLGPGPAWCWLTRSGLAVTGQHYTLTAASAAAPRRTGGYPASPGAGPTGCGGPGHATW
jgi:hypothetical protein